MNKKIISIMGLVILIVACVSMVIFSRNVIKLNNIENVSIIIKDENSNVVISDLNDIKTFKKMLSKYPVSDSPSCPFGYVEIQMNQNDGKIIFFPATDGCHIIKTNNKYFHLFDNEWECLILILKKYDIDRSLLESGKGI